MLWYGLFKLSVLYTIKQFGEKNSWKQIQTNGERKENGLYAVVPSISGPKYGVSREGIEVNHSLIAPNQHRTAGGNVMRI